MFYINLIFLIFIGISTVRAQYIHNLHLIKNLNVRPDQDTTTLGSKYAAIWGWTSQGYREYAILCCVTGTSFIDITDTSLISECDFIEANTAINREVKTYLNYAYITSDFYHGQWTGLQIVDLSYLPDSVHLVKNWIFGNFKYAHTLYQDKNFLYLNGGNVNASGGITIIDISDPVNPVKRAEYTRGFVHDCYVKNDKIYAALTSENKYIILDATNKDSIIEIEEFNELPGYNLPHSCWLSDNGKILITANESRFPPGIISFWNIKELKNIQFLSSYRPPADLTSIAHNIFVRDNILFVSHHTAGLRVLDIREPANPVEFAYHDTYPASNSTKTAGNWGCYPYFNSGKIISSDMQTGLYVHRLINDPTGILGNNILINKYYISQNYPNPFNPKTIINYKCSKFSEVKIKVYDVLGNEVVTLVNQKQNAGNYSIEFDGRNYTSGVYFYSLLVNNNLIATKKMLLIK